MSAQNGFKSVKLTVDGYNKLSRARALLIDRGIAMLPVELQKVFVDTTHGLDGRQKGVGLGVVMELAATLLLAELERNP